MGIYGQGIQGELWVDESWLGLGLGPDHRQALDMPGGSIDIPDAVRVCDIDESYHNSTIPYTKHNNILYL